MHFMASASGAALGVDDMIDLGAVPSKNNAVRCRSLFETEEIDYRSGTDNANDVEDSFSKRMKPK